MPYFAMVMEEMECAVASFLTLTLAQMIHSRKHFI